MGEVLKRAVGGGRSESSAAGAPEVDGVSPSALFTAGEGSSSSNPVITEANAERLAEALCRMRGAALKLGQMISIQDESVMSPQLLRILDRVRANADIMPAHQVQSMLTAELGPCVQPGEPCAYRALLLISPLLAVSHTQRVEGPGVGL